MSNDTIAKLSAIADAAQFERIATCVLRAACPARYGNLSHPGVNPDGKTVKGPFDNFGWVHGPDGPALVGAAHTTEKVKQIKGKWLHDPSTVTPRKGGKPTQPAGDLFKAIKEIEQIRKEHPGVKAFYALTSNREEPPEARIAAETLAYAHDIVLDVWSGSRLAQFLDTNPDGQAIRREHFGVPVTRISMPELLRIGTESLRARPAPTEEDTFVTRSWPEITSHTLVSGSSGMGKSTFCRHILTEGLKRRQPGIILDDQTVADALSIEEALDIELRRTSPTLEQDAGARALQLCSESDPILVVVEDVSRSNNPGKLLNKLASWTGPTASESTGRRWRLICPLWTQFLSELEPADDSKQSVVVRSIGVYSDQEAVEAVRRRGAQSGKVIEELAASEIARSLGNDPLLIGLYDVREGTTSTNVIAKYVQRQLDRTASTGSFTSTDLQEAVRVACQAMLERRDLQPTWIEIKKWFGENAQLQALRQIVSNARVFRLERHAKGEVLHARHDRVLSELLAQAAANEFAGGNEPRYLLDPYYSEVVGIAVASHALPLDRLRAITRDNPLIPFYALKCAVSSNTGYEAVAASAIKEWVENPEHRGGSFAQRRFWALTVLAEIDSPIVLELTSYFPEDRLTDPFFKARFRNGDVIAGFKWLCMHPLSVTVPGRREVIQYAIRHFRYRIVKTTAAMLESTGLTSAQRLGPLRLAGYIADPSLAASVRLAWELGAADGDLETFIWAAAQACGDEAEATLGPMCDVWAGLPISDRPQDLSPRDSLGSHGLAWRFAEHVPKAAIPYFVDRAKSSKELNWPITVMLSGVDDPAAVQLVAESIAERIRDFGDSPGFASPFLDGWERSQKPAGRAMSPESKRRLLEISSNANNYEQLRRFAFQLWESSIAPDDLEAATAIGAEDVRYDTAVWARARRKDLTVIPELIRKIREKPAYWWFSGRYLWNQALTEELGNTIRDMAEADEVQGENKDGGIIAEHLLRLEPAAVERLIAPLWDRLKSIPKFVQLALCIDSPKLSDLAQQAIKGASEPQRLLDHFAMTVGIRVQGGWHPTRVEQLQKLAPYLDFLGDRDLMLLWRFCAERRWNKFASEHLEPILIKRDSNEIRARWNRTIMSTSDRNVSMGLRHPVS